MGVGWRKNHTAAKNKRTVSFPPSHKCKQVLIFIKTKGNVGQFCLKCRRHRLIPPPKWENQSVAIFFLGIFNTSPKVLFVLKVELVSRRAFKLSAWQRSSTSDWHDHSISIFRKTKRNEQQQQHQQQQQRRRQQRPSPVVTDGAK